MVSMVTDVVVDRVGNVEGWNGPNNCLSFGAWHEKFLSDFFPMLVARCNGLQNRVIVLEEWAASIVSGSDVESGSSLRLKKTGHKWASARHFVVPSWVPGVALGMAVVSLWSGLPRRSLRLFVVRFSRLETHGY